MQWGMQGPIVWPFFHATWDLHETYKTICVTITYASKELGFVIYNTWHISASFQYNSPTHPIVPLQADRKCYF